MRITHVITPSYFSITGASHCPPRISTAFQIAEPRKVKIRNLPTGMWSRPAGSEIIVRKKGEKRRKNTTQ